MYVIVVVYFMSFIMYKSTCRPNYILKMGYMYTAFVRSECVAHPYIESLLMRFSFCM